MYLASGHCPYRCGGVGALWREVGLEGAVAHTHSDKLRSPYMLHNGGISDVIYRSDDVNDIIYRSDDVSDVICRSDAVIEIVVSEWLERCRKLQY